jgi:DNA primase
MKVSESGAITILCVFHTERTPSLRIWTDGGFYCHGCGVRGHVNDYADLETLAVMVWDRARRELLEAAGQLRIPGT